MRSLERDFTYLLHNLIPHNRLEPRRRKHIEKALKGANQAEIQRAAVAALEDLCAVDYFQRGQANVVNGRARVTYVRNDGNYQIHLALPEKRWRGTAAKTPADAEKHPDTTFPVDAETPPRALDSAYGRLPAIIRSLSIMDEHESTRERLEAIVRHMPEWMGVAAARLTMCEEVLDEGEAHGDYVTVIPEAKIVRRAVYAHAKQSRELELLAGAAAEALGVERPAHHEGVGADTVAVSPVYSNGDFWGVLEVWLAQGEDVSSARERVRAATRLVEQFIENTTALQELTSIDKLTGIYNRPFYDRQVRIEIERAQRSQSKLSMLVIDVDDFKRINDTLGHLKGNEALAMVADLIQRNLRKIDIPFRYGGEEFVVLLPGTAEPEARHTAERLRSVIAENEAFADADGKPWRIYVSIGAAVFPDHARTEEELFAKADAALYRAKRRGKNRVEFHVA